MYLYFVNLNKDSELSQVPEQVELKPRHTEIFVLSSTWIFSEPSDLLQTLLFCVHSLK